MAANSYATAELAELAAEADDADQQRYKAIQKYSPSGVGWNPALQQVITHVIVQVGANRWIVLKDATGGNWTEDGVL
jgi:hypothetical protein